MGRIFWPHVSEPGQWPRTVIRLPPFGVPPSHLAPSDRPDTVVPARRAHNKEDEDELYTLPGNDAGRVHD
jgi:hypothetical protein